MDMTSKAHYEQLIREHRLYTEKESRRLAELDVIAQVTHERAMVAEGAHDAFEEKVGELEQCGYCAAASGALIALAYRERQQARAAQKNLHVYAREISNLRVGRHEDLHIAYEQQWGSDDDAIASTGGD